MEFFVQFTLLYLFTSACSALGYPPVYILDYKILNYILEKNINDKII